MLTMYLRTMLGKDGTTLLDHDNFFAMFQDVLEEFQSELRASGQDDLFHGAKVRFVLLVQQR